MTLVASLAGSDVAHKVKIGAIGLTTSATGEPGTGSIIFDDPGATMVVRSWMRVIVTETDCTAAPVLFSGWVVKKSISRSDGESTYLHGAARYITTTLVDANTLLYFRAMFAAAAKRPKESEEDRINWLLLSDYLSDLVIDDGLVNSSDTRILDESDYRKQYPGDLLADLVNSWIYFVYPIQPAGTTFGLYYNPPSSTTGPSDLSISNDRSDVTFDANENVIGDCFPPQIDAVMEQDGSEIWAREGLTWTGGFNIRSRADTYATFFQDAGLGYRSRAIESDRVHTEPTAIAYLDRSLASHATEDETITVTIRVPSEKVGLVQAGNRMPTKFLHFNDTDFVDRRNTGIEIHQPIVGKYDITLVLNQRGIPGSGTGGGTGDFPHPPPAVGAIVQQVSGSGNIQMPNPIGVGNTLIFAGTCRNAAMVTSWITDGSYTECPDGQSNDPGGTNTAVVVYKGPTTGAESQYIGGIAGATNIGVETTGTWYEVAGEWTPDTHDERAAASTTVSTPSIAVAANSMTFGVVAQGQGGAYDSVAMSLTYTTAPPFVEDFDTFCPAGGHPNTLNVHYISSGAGSVALGAVNSGNVGLGGTDYNYIAQIVSFTTADLGSTQPPAPGQSVGPETVTMSGADGTTVYPFAVGSLRVYVDNTDQTGAITAQDGAAGTFTLGFTPTITEVVVVYYQGR